MRLEATYLRLKKQWGSKACIEIVYGNFNGSFKRPWYRIGIYSFKGREFFIHIRGEGHSLAEAIRDSEQRLSLIPGKSTLRPSSGGVEWEEK